MVQLPNLELKAERQELVKLMCVLFKRDPGIKELRLISLGL